MSKERILVFLPCFTYGGAEKQGALLARFLRSSGYDVEVWGFPSPDPGGAPLKQLLDSWQVPYRELPRWPNFEWQSSPHQQWLRGFLNRHRIWPRQLREYESELPSAQFDVIVPFTFWPSLVASVMPQRLKARKIIWNHRGGFDAAGISYTPFLIQQILRRRPTFIANSNAGARFLQHTFSLEAHQVQIIRNAYAPEQEEDERESLAPSAPDSAINLLHLANWFPEKDPDTLLEAMRLLKADRVPCRLHLAGAFPARQCRQMLEEKIARLEIQDHVVLHGGVERQLIHDLLGRADVGLLSSRSEGMPNSVMEYMYRGLPVVASDIPGVRELVGDDNGKWLFPVGDAAGLKHCIEALAGDRMLRRELGAANRERIINEFGVARIMPQWIELCAMS